MGVLDGVLLNNASVANFTLGEYFFVWPPLYPGLHPSVWRRLSETSAVCRSRSLFVWLSLSGGSGSFVWRYLSKGCSFVWPSLSGCCSFRVAMSIRSPARCVAGGTVLIEASWGQLTKNLPRFCIAEKMGSTNRIPSVDSPPSWFWRDS